MQQNLNLSAASSGVMCSPSMWLKLVLPEVMGMVFVYLHHWRPPWKGSWVSHLLFPCIQCSDPSCKLQVSLAWQTLVYPTVPAEFSNFILPIWNQENFWVCLHIPRGLQRIRRWGEWLPIFLYSCYTNSPPSLFLCASPGTLRLYPCSHTQSPISVTCWEGSASIDF